MADKKHNTPFSLNDDSSPVKRVGDGLKVPDGYFESFAARMADALPRRDEFENPVVLQKPTLWTRVRPYAYMAAMFAGVWLMLHLFTVLSTANPDGDLSIEKNSDLAKAVENEQFLEDYVIDDLNNWDILNTMVEDSVDVYALTDSLYNANPDPFASIPDEPGAGDGQNSDL